LAGDLGSAAHHQEDERFRRRLTENQMMHESLRNHFRGVPAQCHPMAILSAMINAMSCYEPEMMDIDDDAPGAGGGPDHFQGAHHRGGQLQDVHRPAD
jgi:citrate synthase